MPETPLLDGISVVVPVYNAQDSVAELCERLIKVLEMTQHEFEIVLVEDRGTDNSWETITEMAQTEPRVRGIRLGRNYGQHNALLCGLRSARFSRCITLDDDLQNPPEEIPRLLVPLDAGYDVVYGVPAKQTHGALRDFASVITKMALKSAMGVATARDTSAFRALRTSLRDAFAEFQGPYVIIDVLLTWGTTRFTSVQVDHRPRTVGASNYTLRKLIAHAVNMITGFSALPLQVASIIGLLVAALGMILLVYVLVMFVLHPHAVPGFTFLASMIAVFSGAQLFSIGVIGEYLARMHFRLMDKPAYLVEARTTSSAASSSEG